MRPLLALAALLPLIACTHVPPTVTHDPSLPRVELRGHAFHAEAFGPADGPVVIVLHGGPGIDYRYLLELKRLADPYRVVFYDQLGSGLSQRVPAESISVQSFVADLDAMVEHFGQGRPVHLVGHSWGAMLATAYASAHPSKVARMVLAEPGFLDPGTLDGLPQGGWPGWRVVGGFASAWLRQWAVASGDDPYARRDWFMLQVLPLTQDAEELCNGRLPPLQAWRAGSPAFDATLGRMMNDPAWGRSLDFTQGLERLTSPVLFLRGQCNQGQPEAHQRKMMSRFPAAAQARLVTIPEAGHFMFNDQPEASTAAVRRFLAGAD